MVDIILLDLEMPGAGGLEALPRDPRGRRAARKVLIVSSLAEDGAEETVAALALGAADTLPKPGTGRFNGRFSEILLGKLRGARPCRPQPDRGTPEPLRQRSRSPLRAMPTDPIELLAIGASTGGIHALAALFAGAAAEDRRADPGHPASAGAFMPYFARQLGVAAGREAVVAEDGMQLLPDRIVIAPGDAHLDGRRASTASSSPGSTASARRAAACRRSIRCSRRLARRLRRRRRSASS